MENRELQKDEVISVETTNLFINHTTFKVEEIQQKLKEYIQNKIGKDLVNQWLSEGIPCEILSPNQNWQKGTLKLCLQFCPDQTESPLKNVREQIGDRSN